jgi:hypothetical protein
LRVGGLAVTCNLTLPVACAASAAANDSSKGGGSQPAFGYSKYTGWPELKESLMSGDLQAAYMLAPLVMDLADKRVPVKIVSIGHRSGAVIMVRADSAYRHFPRPRRQARRDPQPLRGRLPVPAPNAGQREHDARRRRDRRDGARGHAGGPLRERGRRLLHRRAVRRGCAACRLCQAAAG